MSLERLFSTPSPAVSGTVSVLIVEDEPIVAEDIASRLIRMGYGVAGVVESGAEAIAAAIALHPDLILMDIRLEGPMTGIEAGVQIGRQVSIPLIYLTANADPETLQQVKATRPQGYILKPFKEQELWAAIELALARHQAEVETRKALELAQQSHQEALAECDRKTQSLMIASHELRTPLSLIRFTTDLLREHFPSLTEATFQQKLAGIEIAIDSIDQLIEDILTLGQLSSQLPTFHPIPLNLVGFCADVVEAVQWGIGHQHQIVFTYQGDDFVRLVDHALMKHLLSNLLANAVKYSPEGSVVRLMLRQEAGCLWLQVQDQGIGIPAAELGTLFEPFQRASNVGLVPGTGLGLAIARQVAELHGGTIQVESQVGEGSTFTVQLPETPQGEYRCQG